MKVGKREVPKDEISFEHGGYTVHVFTHKGFVNFNILKDGKVKYGACVTPTEFISILMARSE